MDAIKKYLFDAFDFNNSSILEVFIQFAITFIVVILILSFVSFIFRKANKVLTYLEEKKKNNEINGFITNKNSLHTFQAIVNSAPKIVKSLTLFLAAIYLVQSMLQLTDLNVVIGGVNLYPAFFKLVLLVHITWFLVKLISQYDLLAEESKTDTSLFLAITKLLKIAVIILMSLIILQTLGINITSLIAFGSIGGLAMGLASKDFLANFLGGLVLYLDKPFKTGDFVSSPDKSIEGVIEQINWRRTEIRTLNKSLLEIPNSLFLNIIIENFSARTYRRYKKFIGVRYQDADKLNDINAQILAYLNQHPQIDKNQYIISSFQEFNNSSLDLLIEFFLPNMPWKEYLAVTDEVQQKIYQIIRANKADVAFPTSEVYLHQ